MTFRVRERFKEYYNNQLKQEAIKYKDAFLSVEEEYKRVARKYPEIPKTETIKSQSRNGSRSIVSFGKLQSLLDVSPSREIQDVQILEELDELDEYNLTMQDGISKNELNEPKDLEEKPKAADNYEKNKYDFESYKSVERRVNKVLSVAVEDLEKDLTLLPEKQKSNKIISRLSSIAGSPQVKTNEPVKLPKLSVNKHRRTTHNRNSFAQKSMDISFDPNLSITQISNIPDQPTPNRPLAGFYVKEKKRITLLDREKEEIRKNCMDLFNKRDPRVGTLSKRYLFNLTQHNNSAEGSECRDVDQGAGNKSIVREVYPIDSASPSPAPNCEKSFYNSLVAGNPAFHNTSDTKFSSRPTKVILAKKKRSHVNSGSVSVVNFNKSHLVKNESLFSRSKSPESKNLDLSMNKFGGPIEKKNEYIYEGMGLLTLYNQDKNSIVDAGKVNLDYFGIHVKKLRPTDYKYVEKKTGANIRHMLYDEAIHDDDIMRFSGKDTFLL